MLFHSVEFVVLFALVLLLLALKRKRVRQLTLLLASYAFYMWFSVPLLGLLLFSTGLDFLVGRALHRSEDGPRRKLLLGLSLAGNLGVLAFFKYTNWFLGSVNSVSELVTGSVPFAHYDIILPLGISFYTFQTLSYTIDVYQRRLVPVKSLMDFATYVAFFPQLVAGPIVRASYLLPQLERGPHYAPQQIRHGIGVFVFGLVKKVCVADRLAPLINEAFANPDGHGSLHLLLATYAFALQIYCDFSGYTDMARGVGFVLGYDVGLNFDFPYLSRRAREFWRRWHISLSTWLRDYLYISLGGNRCSPRRRTINVMITMLLGGLWHGANWTFVVWGAFHGAWIAVEMALARRKGEPDAPARPRWIAWTGQVVAVLFTFHMVCVGWVFFRAESLSDAMTVLRIVFSHTPSEHAPLVVLPYLGAVFFADLLCRTTNVRGWLLLSAWRFWSSVWTGFAILLVLGRFGGRDFVYFQF